MSDHTVYDEDQYEAEPERKSKSKTNGAKRKNTADPLPGLDLRELIEEHNWTALAGLSLIGVGLVYIVFHVLNISFALWAWMMLAAGAWLAYDAWQKYNASGQTWTGNTRNRMMAGVLIALLGLLGTLHINWWSVMLLGTGGWLAYDTWKKVDTAGRVWTQHARNRMFWAGAMIVIGLLGFIPSWSTWPLLIIVIGVVMLYRHTSGKSCC